MDKKFRDEPVKTVFRHWICGEKDCGGEMTATGRVFDSYPPQMEHKCSTCGRTGIARDCSYPMIAHVIEKG